MKKFDCPLRSVRAFLLLALLVAASFVGTAYGKYKASVALPTSLTLSVEAGGATLIKGTEFYTETKNIVNNKLTIPQGSGYTIIFGDASEYSGIVSAYGADAVNVAVDPTTGQRTDAIKMYTDTQSNTLYVLSDGVIRANPDCSLMFNDGNGTTVFNEKLTSIVFNNFDTSIVENMEGMFLRCYNLTSLDLSGFNTSNVTNMYRMFLQCENMTSVNFGDNFDTSSVTDMSVMFSACKSLTSLDLSGFDTGSVTNMTRMFSGLTATEGKESLSILDLRSFNTSKVEKMGSMFIGSTSLKTIIVPDSGLIIGDQTTTTHMFNKNQGGKDLVLQGGAGTKWDSRRIDGTYARIDGGATAPGYFTSVTQYENSVNGQRTYDTYSASFNNVTSNMSISTGSGS